MMASATSRIATPSTTPSAEIAEITEMNMPRLRSIR